MGEIRVPTEGAETQEECLSPLQNLFWVSPIGQRPWQSIGKGPVKGTGEEKQKSSLEEQMQEDPKKCHTRVSENVTLPLSVST